MRSHGLFASVLVIAAWIPSPVIAIETHPTQDQIEVALAKGKEAALQRRPPDVFYTRFGAVDDLHPNGFLITKLEALAVLATHTALRGAEPSEADIAQVLDAKAMLISAVILGNAPTLAVDSYMVLDQAGHTIKPVTIRFDGQGSRSAAWPDSPRFKAKVVASFNYVDFDPMAATTVTVFPANGGEVTFPLDFAQIK